MNIRIEEARPTGAGSPTSRQVSWYAAFTFASRFADRHGLGLDHLPIAGTPQWCGMPDDDARKLLALVLGGVREALNHDARQTATVDASHEIASAADWSALSRRIYFRSDAAYIPRRSA